MSSRKVSGQARCQANGGIGCRRNGGKRAFSDTDRLNADFNVSRVPTKASLEASPPTNDSPGLWRRQRLNSSLVEGTVAETGPRHTPLTTDCLLRHTVTHVAYERC